MCGSVRELPTLTSKGNDDYSLRVRSQANFQQWTHTPPGGRPPSLPHSTVSHRGNAAVVPQQPSLRVRSDPDTTTLEQKQSRQLGGGLFLHLLVLVLVVSSESFRKLLKWPSFVTRRGGARTVGTLPSGPFEKPRRARARAHTHMHTHAHARTPPRARMYTRLGRY